MLLWSREGHGHGSNAPVKIAREGEENAMVRAHEQIQAGRDLCVSQSNLSKFWIIHPFKYTPLLSFIFTFKYILIDSLLKITKNKETSPIVRHKNFWKTECLIKPLLFVAFISAKYLF